MKEKNIYKNNLKLTLIESVLTSIGAGFSVPIMTVFWNSIGMNQTDIGFVQMIFTIVLVFLDIPMGYIADKTNRKVLNIIGDLGVAFTFVLYSISNNMAMVILAECCLGIFMATTNGVDQSFIKYNADKIDSSGQLFQKMNTKVNTYKYIATFSVMLIGGIIAKYNLRATIAISFVPYCIGGIIAFFIKDFAKKIPQKHKNILKDMYLNLKEILSNKKERIYVSAYMVGKEITHPQIWIFTPLLIAVGVPIEIVSIGWIFSEVFKILGAKLAEKIVNVKTSIKFLVAVSLMFLWMSTIVIKLNIYTVWIFLLNGLVAGMMTGSLITPIQENAKEEYQTSVMSIASTGARLLYIPIVYIINYLGNIKLEYSLIGMIIIFLPISIIIYKEIKNCEES